MNKKMEYQFCYLGEEGILQVTATGTWVESEFPEVVEHFVAELDEHNCRRALIDYRDFSIADKPFEIYGRPSTLRAKGGTPPIVMAVVGNELTAALRFLETVYVNQGFTVKIFTDIDSGMDWLRDHSR